MFKTITNHLKKVFIILFIILLPFLIFKFMPLRYKLECKLFLLNTINKLSYNFFNIPSEQILGFLVLLLIFLLFIIGDDDDNKKL